MLIWDTGSIFQVIDLIERYHTVLVKPVAFGGIRVLCNVSMWFLTSYMGLCQGWFSSTILLGGPELQGTNEEVSPDTSRC